MLCFNTGTYKILNTSSYAAYDISCGTDVSISRDGVSTTTANTVAGYNNDIYTLMRTLYPSRVIIWNSHVDISSGILFFIDNASMNISNPSYYSIFRYFDLFRGGSVVLPDAENDNARVYLLHGGDSTPITLMNTSVFTCKYKVQGFVIGYGGDGGEGIFGANNTDDPSNGCASGGGGGAGSVKRITPIITDTFNMGVQRITEPPNYSDTVRVSINTSIVYNALGGMRGGSPAGGVSRITDGYAPGSGGAGAYNIPASTPMPAQSGTTNTLYGANPGYANYGWADGIPGSGIGAGAGGHYATTGYTAARANGGCGAGGWDPTKLLTNLGINLQVPNPSWGAQDGGVILVISR